MTDRSTLLGVPVIPAPHRAARPSAFAESNDPCPFCPGEEARTPPPIVVIGEEEWDLRVVPNLYPIIEAGPDGPRHEVVIETRDHHLLPVNWAESQVRKVVDVWIDRLTRLSDRRDVAAALMFRNQGARGGASLIHPHSQIIGLDEVPERITRRCVDPCVVCAELSSSRRVLGRAGDLVAWCPASPLMPWEIAISSRSHTGRVADLEHHAGSLTSLLRRAIAALEALGLADQNWLLLAAPRDDDRGAFHWTMSLHPRVSAVAGFELATGTFVAVVDADRAHRELVEVFNGA